MYRTVHPRQQPLLLLLPLSETAKKWVWMHRENDHYPSYIHPANRANQTPSQWEEQCEQPWLNFQ